MVTIDKNSSRIRYGWKKKTAIDAPVNKCSETTMRTAWFLTWYIYLSLQKNNKSSRFVLEINSERNVREGNSSPVVRVRFDPSGFESRWGWELERPLCQLREMIQIMIPVTLFKYRLGIVVIEKSRMTYRILHRWWIQLFNRVFRSSNGNV